MLAYGNNKLILPINHNNNQVIRITGPGIIFIYCK